MASSAHPFMRVLTSILQTDFTYTAYLRRIGADDGSDSASLLTAQEVAAKAEVRFLFSLFDISFLICSNAICK
jgi:hypothetical protein